MSSKEDNSIYAQFLNANQQLSEAQKDDDISSLENKNYFLKKEIELLEKEIELLGKSMPTPK